MTDHAALKATGRRLCHPVEHALESGSQEVVYQAIRTYGFPRDWAYLCMRYDQKSPHKPFLLCLTHTIFRCVAEGLVPLSALSRLCESLLSRHSFFNCKWQRERTLAITGKALTDFPLLLDEHFRGLMVESALRNECLALFDLAKEPRQSIKPTAENLFALCEGRGTLLEATFTPYEQWAASEQLLLLDIFLQTSILHKPSNQSQIDFLTLLVEKGLPDGFIFSAQYMKHASVRQVIVQKSLPVNGKEVRLCAASVRTELCLARLISADEANVKISTLTDLLACDLGL